VPSPAEALTIEQVLATSRRVGADLSLGYEHSVQTLLEEIRLVSGSAACQLVEWYEGGPRIVAESARPGNRDGSGPVVALTTNVPSTTDGRVVGEIRVLVDEGVQIPDDAATFISFLSSGLASLVSSEGARGEAARIARESAAAARDAMAAVRAAEDEIGNSISVVLAWLQMEQDRAGLEIDGLSTAIRRLEDVHGSVTRLLQRTQADAIRRHAGERINASALFPARIQDAVEGGIWITASRAELVALLALEPALFGEAPTWSEFTWSLPIHDPALLSGDIAIAIAASGGTIAVDRRGSWVSWPRVAARAAP
jgi:hypothetical protein